MPHIDDVTTRLESPLAMQRRETARYAITPSRSMLARDVLPDRLVRAKLEVGSLLDGLAGDRVALVVFAAEPFVQCPLTTDYEAARVFLRAVGPDSIPSQGTDVGAALSAAAEVLHAASGAGTRARVVLLVSVLAAIAVIAPSGDRPSGRTSSSLIFRTGSS